MDGTAPLDYNWTGPNGYMSADADISVSEQGTYNVTVTDANGCSDTDEVEVTILNLVVADITTPVMACPENDPGIITGIAATCADCAADAIIEYTWECRETDGAGGWLAWTTIPAATDVSYDPPVQTVNKQYRRIASLFGCNVDYPSNEVEIEICPCFGEAGDDLEICQGEEVMLDASGTGFGTLSYMWSPATSLDDPTIASPIATPIATTVYSVTVTDETGCMAIDEVIVTVQDSVEIFCERYRVRYDDANWQPWIPFTGDCVFEVCEGTGITDIQFDGGPNINTGWTWTDEDGNIDSEVDELVVFANLGLDDAGIYTGELDTGNGCVSRLSFEVIVHANIAADAGPDLVYCNDGSGVTLTATGGIEYLWDDPAGSTTSEITVFPTETTTYNVTVTDGICTDVAQVTVTVNQLPTPDAGADVEFCEGEDVQLMATGGVSYEWSPATGLSNPNIFNPIASPTETTTYTVTVTDANGCMNTDEVTITVHENLDASAIAVEHDFCEDGSGEATVTVLNGTGPFTIEWQTTEGTEAGNASLLSIGDYTITGLNGGTTYCIQVTDSNGCRVVNP